MALIDPNKNKIVKTPYEVSGVILEANIPNKNGRVYSPAVFDKLKPSKLDVHIDGVKVGQVNSFYPSKPLSGLEMEDDINHLPPELQIESIPIHATNRKLKAIFTLEPPTITFQHNNKKFAILPKNKKLAEKLVTLQLKDWVTYLQYEDDGIVQLVKYLCKMKYEETEGEDIIFETNHKVYEIMAKQIEEEVNKNILKDMLGENNG